MTTQAHSNNSSTKLNRNVRSMPKWVNESSDRIGPKPPPPPPSQFLLEPKNCPALPPKSINQSEPDYEVIEFSGQHYSNEPAQQKLTSVHQKTLDPKLKCTLCGSGNPWVTCDECSQQLFCASCDDMFHKHPKRKSHVRKNIDIARPPVPPKTVTGQSISNPPIAPPRRGKKGVPTPLMQRKDQVTAKNTQTPFLSNSTAKRNWNEHCGSLQHGLNLINRPLPETPKTPTPSESASSRSTTPKSVFDNIQRPPSVTLTKIKSKANATLDRMALLQQRYRQQKESNGVENSMKQGKPTHRQPESGLQRMGPFGSKNLSRSVFNLNRITCKPSNDPNNSWTNNEMHQAQSVAQLNCMNCNRQQQNWITHPHQHNKNTSPGEWGKNFTSQQKFNHSNLSLNIPAGYMVPHSQNGAFATPMFINQHGIMSNIYPHPYLGGLPVMTPGLMGMPPTSRSRGTSRAGSRLPSPTTSRKCISLRRKRNSYADDELTDDEDSDQEDRRSLISNRSGLTTASRSRQRRPSNSSQGFLDNESEISNSKIFRTKLHDQNRNSISKSSQNNWTSERRDSFNSVGIGQASIGLPVQSSKIYSDLDSESSDTRALVQAKIQQKLKDGSIKNTPPLKLQQSKGLEQNPLKVSTEIQTESLHKELKNNLYIRKDAKNETANIYEEKKHICAETETYTQREPNFDSVNEKESHEKTSLGPPPSTPDYEWECEFCTFVNEANIKICSICCKTPSTQPPNAYSTELNTNKKECILSENCSSPLNKVVSSTTNVKKELPNPKLTSSENESDNSVKKKKESLEDIWAALDENIQTTADEVKRKAATNHSNNLSIYHENSSTKKYEQNNIHSKETGTPQNISTQTYDVLPLQSLKLNEQDNTNIETSNKTKCAENLVTQIQQEKYKTFDISESNTALRHDLHQYINPLNNQENQNQSTSYFQSNEFGALDLEKFPSLRQQQASFSELLALQASPSHMHSLMYSLQNDSTQYNMKTNRDPEKELFILLKEAESHKFSSEELQAALKYCGIGMHPIQWLKENWSKLIFTVQTISTQYGLELDKNIIGAISETEARNSLCIHYGNIMKAVSECIERRQEKYHYISSQGNFARDDIVMALTTHQGNTELALTDLRKTQLNPFLMRIVGSPGGVDNESGCHYHTQPTSQGVNTDVDSEGKTLLKTNSLEFQQNPTISGTVIREHLTQIHQPLNVKHNYTPDNKNSCDTTENNEPPANLYRLNETVCTSKGILKDFENVIANMESKQLQNNKQIIRSVEDLLRSFMEQHQTGKGIDQEVLKILTKCSKRSMTPPMLIPLSKKNINSSQTTETANVEITKVQLKTNVNELLNIRTACIKEEIPPEFIEVDEIPSFEITSELALETGHEEIDLISLSDITKNIYKIYIFKDLKNKGNINSMKQTKEENVNDSTYDSKERSNFKIIQILPHNMNSKSTISDMLLDQKQRDNNVIISNMPELLESSRSSYDFQIYSVNCDNIETKNKGFVKIDRINENSVANKENDLVENDNQQKINEKSSSLINTTIIRKDCSKLSLNVKSRSNLSKIPVRTPSRLKYVTGNNYKEANILTNSAEDERKDTWFMKNGDENVDSAVRDTLNENPASSQQNVVIDHDSSKLHSFIENEDIFKDASEHSSEDEDKHGKPIFDESSAIQSTKNYNSYETSEEELYSINSDNSLTDLPQRDRIHSPNSECEMLLVLGNSHENIVSHNSETASTINNNHASNTEFIHSAEPSKQNLSELVKDTQRLIKQMKDEINMEAFDSSDDIYTDNSDNSEENYLNEEEDEWIDEYTEDEEDVDDKNEAEEYANGNLQIEAQNDIYSKNNPNGTENQSNLIPSKINCFDQETASSDNTADGTKFGENKTILNKSNSNFQNDSDNVSLVKNAIAANPNRNLENNYTQNAKTLTLNTHDCTYNKNNKIEFSLEELQKNSLLSPKNENHSKEHDLSLIEEKDTPTFFLNLEKKETLSDLPPTFKEQKLLTSKEIHSKQRDLSSNKETYEATFFSNLDKKENSSNLSTVLNKQQINCLHPPIVKDFKKIQETHETDLENRIPELPAENILSNSFLNVSTNLQSSTTELEQTITEKVNQTSVSIEPQSKSVVYNIAQNQSLIENNNVTPLSANDKKNKKIQNEQTENVQQSNSNQIIKPTTAHRSTSKIPKPKESSKHSFKKTAFRSKSFSGAATPIGICSVKALQQEFLNKQFKLTGTSTQRKIPPLVAKTKSIKETIIQLTSSSTTNSADVPSTSGMQRTKIQTRTPNKKYHETCFSDDDYESTSSEEELEPIEVRQRKFSVPVFRAYPSIQEPETINTEILACQFLDDELVSDIFEARIAADLVNLKFPQDISLWAARECSDLEKAITLLQQECELCMGTYTMNQIVSMLKCTHKCCKQCAKTYFTVQITDRTINDCNCPFCKVPELHDQAEHEDENLEYFSNLDIFLKSILDTEVHELFQRKLRDRTLLQDPNFKWCIQCSSGFFARPKQRRLICPDCGSVTCSQCRKPWEKQHEGISCEQFLEWKQANDPEVQAQGVQEHLTKNGIDCPKCKFRYSLARGGCMHFTCTQCKFEFCYGCAKPFMMGAKCNISPYCSKLGLHAHHPRNCLFYLRDKLPLQLQFLLKEKNISFDVDPGDVEYETKVNSTSRCPIPMQKETPKGLVDTVCNNEVPDKHAGMCRVHYVEYLSAKVANARIDPLPIFDLTDCIQELRRRGIPLPERGPWDTDEIYKNMCAEVIKHSIPLESEQQ